jgi:hypothetical protein
MLFFLTSSIIIISLSELFLQRYCIIIKQYDLNYVLLKQCVDIFDMMCNIIKAI